MQTFLTSAPADQSANLASAATTRFACCRYHRRMWQFMVFTPLTNCEASAKSQLSLLELSILAGLIPGGLG